MQQREKSPFLNEEWNPCLKESKISMRCLDTKGYNFDECKDEFENFKRCKKFWGAVQSFRMRNGIKPHMPDVEERKSIKADYLAGNYNPKPAR